MKALLIAALWVGCASVPVHAQVFKALDGRAVFESSAQIESFQGTSPHLAGLVNLADSTVDFYLDLNTLETGISLRDRQMRDQFLETKRFPYAEFTGRLYTPVDLSSSAPQKVFVQGGFTVHGVRRVIDVVGTITPMDADRIRVQAEWDVRLKDHDIEVPSLLVFRLNETIRVTIDLAMTKVP